MLSISVSYYVLMDYVFVEKAYWDVLWERLLKLVA